MNVNEHTPEPWGTAYREDSEEMYHQDIFGPDEETLAVASWYPVKIDNRTTGTNREANARRIVACVNACRGISNEVLEDPDYSIKAELDSIDELFRLRKEAEKNIADYRAEIDTLNNHIRSILAGSGVPK